MSKRKAEKKVEEKKVEIVKPSFDLENKIKSIRASKMPKAQQDAYIDQISPRGAKAKVISLKIYLAKRGIADSMLAAYAAYPKAKEIRLATPSEWDEIFKKF